MNYKSQQVYDSEAIGRMLHNNLRSKRGAMCAEREAREDYENLKGVSLNEMLAARAAVRTAEKETRRMRDIYFETQT